MTMIILAIVLGAAFGFALDRIGATNPDYIIGMLRLSRMHLMKTILLAIGVASVLMFAGLLAGLIDPAHLGVKTAYFGVFAGGALLGLGFAVAGYCPGTGLAAAATGRKDAMFFVIGGLGGAAAYMATYAGVAATGVLAPIAGGKTTIGAIAGTSYPAVLQASGEVLGIVLGLVLIGVAYLIPDRIRGKTSPAGRDPGVRTRAGLAG
ncbi:YeeE/YedE thiosulfate transporter family protein [Aurantimonas sp. VKM B-3413]|uniref:YeeE/YedE thiosulfate transporter family protein n=1 Tax=Aurantimonas sp. VKM B-3413 TaxID=2779401 RepID=UPI001E515052|nr:YeeE/YedE thiosulfate transporter family protein [Aurantimonas sp. VKM B-3413]MCB8840170.1 YeeE/YedE family protein [Aurantimonas sp. VKM B-3413]